MKSAFILSIKAWVAIALVTCVLAAFAISTGQFLIAIAAFSTAGIAAFDSTHVRLRRYKTGLSYGPVGLFMVCALCWPIGVIWYFIVRVRIARGTMPLRADFSRAHLADG